MLVFERNTWTIQSSPHLINEIVIRRAGCDVLRFEIFCFDLKTLFHNADRLSLILRIQLFCLLNHFNVKTELIIRYSIEKSCGRFRVWLITFHSRFHQYFYFRKEDLGWSVFEECYIQKYDFGTMETLSHYSIILQIHNQMNYIPAVVPYSFEVHSIAHFNMQWGLILAYLCFLKLFSSRL